MRCFRTNSWFICIGFAIHQIKIAQAQRFFVLKTQFLTEVNHAVIESRKGIYRLDNLKNELLSIVDYNSDPKILDAIQRTQDSLKPYIAHSILQKKSICKY